jgi:hypothetical protein
MESSFSLGEFSITVRLGTNSLVPHRSLKTQKPPLSVGSKS